MAYSTSYKLQILMAILLVVVGSMVILHRIDISDVPTSKPAEPAPAGLQASIFDYSEITDVKEKKKLFFDTLRPVVQKENKEILALRDRLLSLTKSSRSADWVLQVADRFGIENFNSEKDWSELLKRVDIVPLEMVLAQAAMESGWGESRFAQQGNNLFGQWCFTKGCGIVPKHRKEGAIHEVRRFDSINDALAAYIHNINTGHAYDILRTLRARLRFRNKPLDGNTLAGGLVRYSERGSYYVMEIRQVMRVNEKLIMGTGS